MLNTNEIMPYGDDGSAAGGGYVAPTAAASTLSIVPPADIAGVQLIGIKATDLVKTGDHFIATWSWDLAAWLPASAFNAPSFAVMLRDALPNMGFIPASQPSAVAGDTVITFDVRLNNSWGTGRNVAHVAKQLDTVPILSGGATLSLSILRTIVPTQVGSGGVTDTIGGQTAGGNKTNEEKETWLGKLWDEIKDVSLYAGVGIGLVAVVALGVYLYKRKR